MDAHYKQLLTDVAFDRAHAYDILVDEYQAKAAIERDADKREAYLRCMRDNQNAAQELRDAVKALEAL